MKGNVRQKLQIAQLEYTSGVSDLDPDLLSSLEGNITALQQVQPLAVLPPAGPEITALCALGVDLEKLPLADRSLLMGNTIEVRLGVTWIPSEVCQQFLAQVLNINARVSYLAVAHSWIVSGRAPLKSAYNTQRRDALTLLEHGLNQKDPLVYDTTRDDQRVLNAAASEAVRAMALSKIYPLNPFPSLLG